MGWAESIIQGQLKLHVSAPGFILGIGFAKSPSTRGASCYQASWATTQLIPTGAGPIHPVDECIPLFQVLLKEIRMLSESKVLSICFWC